MSLVLIAAAGSIAMAVGWLQLQQSSSATAQEKKTPQAEQREKIDFRMPARVYKPRKLGRWSFQVEEQLLKEDPDLARQTLERLEKKLNEALTAVLRE